MRGLRAVVAAVGGLFVLATAGPALAGPTPPPLPDDAIVSVAPSPNPEPDGARRDRAEQEAPPEATPAPKPSPEPLDCGQFARTQTYAGWGPAAFYGSTVTVDYRVDSCRLDVDGTAADLSVTGTAAVYEGDAVTGAPIDTRPFDTTASWRDAEEPGVWPLAWWQCSVRRAHVLWRMPGAYVFEVTALNGTWSLRVSVNGKPAFHWVYSAC